VLNAVVDAGHELVLVLCQPDRPAGRGQRVVAPPVKRRALELGLEVGQPARLREEADRQRLREVRADLMLVVAYGLILPRAVLDIPAQGCINVHASLLPRWRGAAPIQRAIEAGDRETGITIMQMDEGLDTGPMLLREAVPISDEDCGGTLHDRLAAVGARLAVAALERLGKGGLVAESQPDHGVCYARKIDRSEAMLDWRLDAGALVNRIRAFDPVPGCTAVLESDTAATLKIWRARLADVRPDNPAGSASVPAGTVLPAPAGVIRVACGQGAIDLTELQRPGGTRQLANAFLRGRPIAPGDRFRLATD
jgi:methionyl-tRNA formyltransferase